MIWALAFLEMWQRRTALLVQVAGLTIAIAALIASMQISKQANTSYVPGASCPELGFLAVRKHQDGSFKGVWNSTQIRTLRAGLHPSESEQIAGVYLPVETRKGQENIYVGLYGPQLMKMLCVQTRETMNEPMTEAVINEDLSRRLEDSSSVFNTPVMAIATQFKGIMPDTFPQAAWLPIDQGAVLGIDADATNDEVINLWIKPDAGRTEKAVLNDINQTIHNNPAIFSGVESVVPVRNLELGALQISRLKQSATLLSMYAIGLILLAIINLTIYHASRSQQTSALVKLLKSLGIPPGERTKIAILEPLLMAIVACLLGGLASQPLAVAMMSALSKYESGAKLTVSMSEPLLACIAIISVITGIAIALRVRHFHKGELETHGKSQRRIITWTPWLLMVQTIIAILLIVSAAQAAIGLYRNLPAEPNYQLDGLTMVRFNPARGEKLMDVELQWQSALKRNAVPGINVAIAQNGTPIANQGFETAFIDRGGEKQEVYINRVSRGFFEVLKLPVSSGPNFPMYPSEDAATKEAPEIIINEALRNRLYGNEPATGMLNKITSNILNPGAPATVVGAVVEGGTGRAVTALNQEPLQAYMPLTRMDDQAFPILFIRHPENMSSEEAFEKTQKIRDAFSPNLLWQKPIPAREAFKNVLRRERAITMVLILLAVASMIAAAMGLFSVQLLVMSIIRVELAVSLASGASRWEAGLKMLGRLVPAVLIGMLIAALPAWLSIDLLAQMVETTKEAGHQGFYIGVVIMLTVIVLMGGYGLQTIRRANIIEWLRYE